MASTKLVLLICVIMATAYVTMGAGRGIHTPITASDVKKLHPEWFYDSHDGSFLIPGIGRYMIPSGGGLPTIIGGDNGGITAPRQYIPGGDDTFLPNPGVEIPIP